MGFQQRNIYARGLPQSPLLSMSKAYQYLPCLSGSVINHARRCTYIEHCVNFSKVSSKALRCVTTSIASMLCGRIPSVQQTIRSDRPVATWGSLKIRGDGRTSSAGTGTNWRNGHCRIRPVSSGFLTAILSIKLLRNGSGARMNRRTFRQSICSLAGKNKAS